MKRPNYKDKESTEKKLTEYCEAFVNNQGVKPEDSSFNSLNDNYRVFQLNFGEIKSTHKLAENWNENEIPDNYIIIFKALKQDKGIGFRNTTFESHEGNLFITYMLISKKDFNHSLLTSTISLAVKEFVSDYLLRNGANEEQISKNLGIKWINDIYYEDQKIGGILITSASKHSTSSVNVLTTRLIISVGLNINVAPDVSNIKTNCLKNILKSSTDLSVEEISVKIIEPIFKRYSQLESNKKDNEIIESITDSLLYKEKLVNIVNHNDYSEVFQTGIFVGINENGHALLIDKEHKITANSGKMVLATVKDIQKPKQIEEIQINEKFGKPNDVEFQKSIIPELNEQTKTKDNDKTLAKDTKPADYNRIIEKSAETGKTILSTQSKPVEDFNKKIENELGHKCNCDIREGISNSRLALNYLLFFIAGAATVLLLKKK
jgi:BirA family transcriptional regulator, biotin operon repressor / biotin---[acetyl-CoA-carboxylase] ligase